MPENDDRSIDLGSIDFPVEDPSTLPTNREVPLGDLEFEIKGWQAFYTAPQTDPEKIAKGNKGNKLAFRCQLSVTAPDAFRGFPHTHDHYIGSNDDPEAKKGTTWASNATLMMKQLKEAGVHLGPGVRPQEALQASIGAKVGGFVRLDPAKPYRDKTTGEMKMGREKHVIRGFFKAGTRPYRTLEEGPSGVTPNAPSRPEGLSASD